MPKIEFTAEFKDNVRRTWPNKLLTVRLFHDEAVKLGVLDESEENRGRDNAELEGLLEENRSIGRFQTLESFTKWVNSKQ